MTPQEAYDFVLKQWPETIDLSGTVIHDNGGATIPDLIKVHDVIYEKCMDIKTNRVAEFMDWSFFQYYHGEATRVFKEGGTKLNTNCASINIIIELYNSNAA